LANSCITYVGIYGPYDHEIIRFYQRLDLEKVGDLSGILSQSDDDAGVARRSVVAIEIAKFSFL